MISVPPMDLLLTTHPSQQRAVRQNIQALNIDTTNIFSSGSSTGLKSSIARLKMHPSHAVSHLAWNPYKKVSNLPLEMHSFALEEKYLRNVQQCSCISAKHPNGGECHLSGYLSVIGVVSWLVSWGPFHTKATSHLLQSIPIFIHLKDTGNNQFMGHHQRIPIPRNIHIKRQTR